VVFFVLLIVATVRVGAVLAFSPGSWAMAIISLLFFSLLSIGYMIYKMDEAQKSGMAGLGGYKRCPACGRRVKAGMIWCPGCGLRFV
jgi:membrane protein implicated in regulation of membrane protease activity